jgi:hypothetical protein
MPGWEIVLIAAVIMVVTVVGFLWFERRRSMRLRSRFGPEYERTLQERGDRRRAEDDLARRQERVEGMAIHPLSPSDRDRFLATWHADQERFVDDPAGAVTEADRLVQEVMGARGYAVADFAQRVEDLSVDHPHLVQNYRAAREIAFSHEGGTATTEELRLAMVYYRALFDELLEVQAVER